MSCILAKEGRGEIGREVLFIILLSKIVFDKRDE